jgi:hypothetical protein
MIPIGVPSFSRAITHNTIGLKALLGTLPKQVTGERRFFKTWVRAARRDKNAFSVDIFVNAITNPDLTARDLLTELLLKVSAYSGRVCLE